MKSELIYYYSACIGIKTKSLSILCDPWFTDGAFGGSWFQYPWKSVSPADIGHYDYIYVSHIHPDHYDPVWINSYLECFPQTKVLVAKWAKAKVPLEAKMRRDCISFESIENLVIDDTRLTIIPHDRGSSSDIDSCLVLETDDYCVVNMNDCIWDEEFYKKVDTVVKKYRDSQRKTVGLFSFTPAGPYPHTYYWNDDSLAAKSDEHRRRYLDFYTKKTNQINCTINIPFAGQYILGAGLEKYNKFRGICDAVDVYNIDSKALVLQDYGHGSLDLDTFSVQGKRLNQYSEVTYADRLNDISGRPLTYKTFSVQDFSSQFVLRKLIRHAFSNALRMMSSGLDYCYEFHVDGLYLCSLDLLDKTLCFDQASCSRNILHAIEIESKLLTSLLLGLEHWDNAEKGSMYLSKRTPDIFSREAQSFLHFLTI